MAQIVVISGPNTGQTFALADQQAAVIGSAAGSAIHIPSPMLAPTQAKVSRKGGQTTIANASAETPLMLNGEFVEGEKPLRHGDMIMIADVMLLYDEEVYEDEAGPVAPHGAAPAGDDPTIFHRQKFFDDAELLMKSLQQTSDPSRYLGSFLKVTNALVENIDLPVLLPKILDIVFEVIPADRGTVQLLEGTELVSAASKVRGKPASSQTQVHPSRTIINQVVASKEGVLTRDAMQDDRFSVGMSIVEQKIHACLCVPLIRHTGEVLGVIHLDTTSSGRTFDEDQLKLLTGIAMEASLAIVNARLIGEVGEKKRIERELEIASTIQMGLVPTESPKVPGLAVAGVMIPAKEVGGDYYDFLMSTDGRTFYILIGDVSGKGVPAGLVMIMARCFFRPLAHHTTSPREVIAELNKLLYKDTRRDMFMTMLVFAYDTQTQVLRWCGAGHEHLLVYRAATRTVEKIPSGGVPLAMREGGDLYVDHTLALGKGDSVLLYTDGVTEATDEKDEMYGLDETIKLFAKHGHSEAELIVKSVLLEVQGFIGNAEQSDDITLVAFQKL